MDGFNRGRSTKFLSIHWTNARTAILCAVVLALFPACRRDERPAPQDLGAPAAGPETPAERAPNIPADAPRIVFLGDSITAGLHLAADEAYPAVLQRLLARKGQPFALTNAGVSGATTAAGKSRADWVLAQDPAIVVIQLGANDGFRGIPLQEIDKNLRAIIQSVKNKKATPVLFGMKLPPNYGAAYVKGFEALFKQVAHDTGSEFVPFFLAGVAGHPEFNLPDGIHPNADGHKKIAANLEATMTAMLKAQR